MDTNFLLVPFQFKVDVFKELERIVEEKNELVVVSPCVDELKSLAAGRSRDALAAKAVLSILGKLPVKIVPGTGPADNAIAKYAEKEKAVVCTTDIELRRALKKKGLQAIALRSKSHLAFT